MPVDHHSSLASTFGILILSLLPALVPVPALAATAAEPSVPPGGPSADPPKPEYDASLPLPGEARRTVVEQRAGAKALLWVPRVVLFVPRWVLWTAVQPLRLSLMANERHHVYPRFIDLFFNDARTFGVLPIVRVRRFQGFDVGARLVHHEVFGAGGDLSLRTQVGDRRKQEHRFELDTGSVLGPHWTGDAWAGFAVRSRQNFTGIGNNVLVDLQDPQGLPLGLDAMQTSTGIRTRYREDVLDFGLGIRAAFSDDLSLRLANGWKEQTFADGVRPSEYPITAIYDPATLPGFETGAFQNYTEVSGTYDTTHTVNRWIPPATPSRGWRIRGYYRVGRVLLPQGLYQKFGFDVGRLIDLYHGDRVLRLRLKFDYLQSTSGDTPFTEFPTLGGGDFLRGYRDDRFRDRLAALSTAEYHFPISPQLSAFLFTDVGRVYGGIAELSVRDIHAGFGAGIQIHDGSTFLGRLQLAWGTRGDLLFQLRFEPTFKFDDGS